MIMLLPPKGNSIYELLTALFARSNYFIYYIGTNTVPPANTFLKDFYILPTYIAEE